MIHVEFNPLNDIPNPLEAWCNIWESKAEQATQDLIQKWEAGTLSSNDFDDDLWRELKNFLLDHVFHGKCAYCETHIGEARQPGDAEHFRPKGRVNYKEEPKTSCKKYVRAMTYDYRFSPGIEIEHPGYFWLAYNWKNLLPACKECNSGKGKNNQFPLKQAQYQLNSRLDSAGVSQLKGHYFKSDAYPDLLYYLDVEDLNRLESPYLLNPYFGEDPANHIEFEPKGGIRARKINGTDSDFGKHSIAAYNLEDGNLTDAREKAQIAAKMIYDAALTDLLNEGNNLDEARQLAREKVKIKSIFEGVVPYSKAALDFLRLIFREL
jgi:hypothetical protein